MIGRDLPKIQQPRERQLSIIDGKTVRNFTRMVEQTGTGP
jgi:hypothetical protein